MILNFEWDKTKAESNLKTHGVSFEEASTAFGDPLSLTIHDPQHSELEDRFVLMGHSFENRKLVVVHTDKNDIIRIISARCATRREIERYEEER